MCISSRNLWLEHGKGFKRAFLHILTQLCHTKRSLHNTRLLNAWYHLLLFFCNYKICNLSSALFQLLLPSLSLPSSFRPCHGCLTVLYPVFPCHCSHSPLEFSELSLSGFASNFCSLQPIRRSECTVDYLRDLEMPQDVSEFRCYQNPKDLQESD